MARTRLSAALAWNRLRLPPRYERSSLDGLLARLEAGWGRGPSVPIGALARDFQRVERLLIRAPGVKDTCLFRALSRYAVLVRAGFPAVFVMGLPRSDPDGDGHAWVEVNDIPFAEVRSVAEFAVTFRYPQAGYRRQP